MFTWTDPDDPTVVITLPNMRDIPGGVVRRVRKLPDVDAMFTMLEAVATPDELDRIDALPAHRMNDLFKAWSGGAGAGESVGSST